MKAKNNFLRIALLVLVVPGWVSVSAQNINQYHPYGQVCAGSENLIIFQYTGSCPSYSVGNWQVEGDGSPQITNYNTDEKKVRITWSGTATNARVNYLCNEYSGSTSIFTVYAGGAVSVSINNPGTFCAGTNVTFTATPTNGGPSPTYYWKVNGNTISGQNGYQFSTPSLANGDDVYVNMVSNSTCISGASSVNSNTVDVNVTTPAAVSVGIVKNLSNPVCASAQVTFTAIPSGNVTAATYVWYKNGTEVNDNASSGAEYRPNNPLSTNNTIYCIMTVSSPTCISGNPATSNTITMDIQQTISPSVVISGATTVCDNASTVLSATPASGLSITSYTWSIAGQSGTYSTSTYTPNVDNLSPPSKTINLTVGLSGCMPSGGNSANDDHTITVTPTVGQVPAPNGPASRCQAGGSVSYNVSNAVHNNTTNATSFAWSLTAAAGSIDNSGNVTWNSGYSGTATVGVTANGCGSSSTSNSLQVVVTASVPVGTVSINNPMPFCATTGNPVFSAAPSNAPNPVYAWKKNGSNATDNSSSGSNYTPTIPLQPGDVIRCDLSSSASCPVGTNPSPSNSVTVSHKTPVAPGLSIGVPNQSVCISSAIPQFTASATPSGTTIQSYSWRVSGSGQLSSASAFTPTSEYWHAPGETIQLVATLASSECLTTYSKETSLAETIYALPTPGTLSTSDGPNICSSGTVNFSVSSFTGSPLWEYRSKDGAGASFPSSWSTFSTATGSSANASVISGSGVERYFEFRHRVQNGSCSDDVSNTKSITLYPTPSPGTLSATNGPSFCSSGTVNMSLSPTIGTIAWERRYKDGDESSFPSSWTSSTADAYNGLTTNGSIHRFYEFRVVASTTSCTPVGGTPVLISVYPSSSIGTLGISPGSELYGATAQLNMSVSGNIGTVSYESSTDGTTWSAFSNPGTISHNMQVKGKSVSGICSAAYTSPTQVYLYPVPVITVTGPVYLSYGISTQLSTGTYHSYQWTRNSTDISGATSQQYTASQPGDYNVKVKGSVAAPVASALTPSNIRDGVTSQTDMNFVSTVTFLKENVNLSDLHSLAPNEYNQSTQYFDGLSRPVQSVVTMGSPLQKDIVQPVVYDVYGREARKYLPYVPAENNGRFKSSSLTGIGGFYNGSQFTIPADTVPYARSIFEASPLNRVTEQTSPGEDWRIGSGHTVTKFYNTNGAEDVLYFRYNTSSHTVSISPGTLSKYYPQNSLFANKTVDEHGNDVIEYVDKEGRTLCKKVRASATEYACTYYVYDDFGNLILVLPPEAVKRITNN